MQKKKKMQIHKIKSLNKQNEEKYGRKEAI